jgi:hypothetical protein
VAERMIPVPKSLREQVKALRDEMFTECDSEDHLVPLALLIERLDALLSQSSPTGCSICEGTGKWTEVVRDGFVPRVVLRECPVHGAPAAPPSITDMVPGTTFYAALVGDERVEQWMRVNSCHPVARMRDGLHCWPRDVDPSTIRDVTPPEESS